MAVEAFVGIGSNVEPEQRVRQAVKLLRERFGAIRLSPVYRNAAVGFEGDDFLNLVAAFETALDVDALNAALDEIELACGRERGAARFTPRTMDLDLLLYGDRVSAAPVKLPRPEILKYAFVLKPLADLVPDRRHPGTDSTYAELWARYPGGKSGIDVVCLLGM
ncbi:MAG TPA: 2-amino-4-hydroxy-6-hydroxymethyldihydropteridine diphosphokinase [Gammaproteobacteria bacterium]|nr:2-amino-4-hydroxy-6-hydroxymethyldihydropteridine diphosphokinase [Gammaproteobacteria bacterium]